MIYFFHRRETILATCGGSSFLTWYENQIRASKDPCKKYKIIYDMADYIYDKRFDAGPIDEELNIYVNGTYQADGVEADQRKGQYLRLEALKMLLKKIDAIPPDPENPLQSILFCLAKGNICLRICHCYIHYFDYANSDLYGKQAQELFWRGKQMTDRLRYMVNQDAYANFRRQQSQLAEGPENYRVSDNAENVEGVSGAAMHEGVSGSAMYKGVSGTAMYEGVSGISINECELYVRVLKLNLAKYHRNFARKNRRSDYDAALDEYHHLCKNIQNMHFNEDAKPMDIYVGAMEDTSEEERRELNAIWFRSLPEDLRRRFALLWLDALSDIAFIHRSRNRVQLAHKETILVYEKIKKIMDECQPLHVNSENEDDFLPFRKKADALVEKDREYWRRINGDHREEDDFWFAEEPDVELLVKELAGVHDLQQLALNFELYVGEGLVERPATGSEKPLLPYDIQRFFMLVLNEFSVIRCNLHDTEGYRSSAETALLADEWSRRIDGYYPHFPDKHSIDAMNNLSVAMRKFYKFSQKPRKKEITDPEDPMQPSRIRWLLQLMFIYAEGNYTSKSEMLKWYVLALSMENRLGHEIRNMRKVNEKGPLYSELLEMHFPELTRGIRPDDNVQNLFFCGFLLYRLQAYSDAIRYMDEVLKHKEADYIRVASFGTRVRFIKASCLIALGKYKAAETVLLEMKNTLDFAYQSKGAEAKTSPILAGYRDERIESYLAFCYMRSGDYGKARELYESNLGWMLGETKGKRLPSPVKRRMQPAKQMQALKNLVACLLFNASSEMDAHENQVMVERLFALIDKYGSKRDKQVELLKGYARILYPLKSKKNPEKQEDAVENLAGALEHFSRACDRERGFVSQAEYLPEESSFSWVKMERNESRHRDKVEAFSAYLITLVELAELRREAIASDEEYEYVREVQQIKKMLLSLPESMEVSMKAAMSIACWLLNYKEHTSEMKKATLVPQLFRSFSYIRVFEERGARVFNELKEEKGFRFFSPEQRGEILARLLALYQPIKEIKEVYSFTLKDKTEQMHLCHYTSIETLKVLLSGQEKVTYGDGGVTSPWPGKVTYGDGGVTPPWPGKVTYGDGGNTPQYFRINNCGYMNDAFEGSVFLKKMENMYTNTRFRKKMKALGFGTLKNWDTIQQRYYPQLQHSSEHVIPKSSDVYVASVSVRQDSFPLWSIYGNKENGCNIEFDVNFFDVAGPIYEPGKLRKYVMSRYTDEDYPLYKVHYMNNRELSNCTVNENSKAAGQNKKTASAEESGIADLRNNDVWGRGLYTSFKMKEQDCGTLVPAITELNRCIEILTEQLLLLDDYLDSLYEEDGIAGAAFSMPVLNVENPKETLRSFAAHRIDEVRFLFKNSDYSYESEVRTVYTVSSSKDAETKPQIDLTTETPKVYVNMNREIKDVTVTLGSLIDDSKVDRYVTWLKQTGKVKRVRLSKSNRKK